MRLAGYAYDPRAGAYTKTLATGSKIRILESGDGNYEVYFVYSCQSIAGALEVRVTDLSQFDLGRSLTKIEDSVLDLHTSLVKNKL